MLGIVLNNDFRFEVDSLNEIYTGDAAELVLRCPLSLGQNADEIRRNITSENMAQFTVLVDGEQVDECCGYNEIRSVTKVLTKYERSLIIQCTKGEDSE